MPCPIFPLVLLVITISSSTSQSSRPECPIARPCQCLWDNYDGDKQISYNIVSCKMRQLTEDTLPRISDHNLTIYKVDYSNNRIDGIPAGYFDSFRPGVRVMELSFNALRTVPDAIRPLRNLQRLSLVHNSIDIPAGEPFIEMSGLEYLALTKNGISVIKKDTFKGLTSLEKLMLDSNLINDIEDDAFVWLSQINAIDLSNNRLTSLRSEAFKDLTSLSSLILNNNQLSSLPSAIFSDLRNLQKLELRANGLQSLDAASFTGLSSVTNLDLSNNTLSGFPSQLFEPLPQLRNLNIGMNRLQSVDVGSFRSISQTVTLLRMSFNPINDFPPDFFTLFPELQVLLITGLRVERLPNVTALRKLTVMSAAGTAISHIYPCEWEGLVQLTTFSLANCPLACDCNARWLWEWYDQHLDEDTRKFTESRAPWTCSSPPALKGRHFHNVTPNELVCGEENDQRWCANMMKPPQTSVQVFLTGNPDSQILTWNTTGGLANAKYGTLTYFPVDIRNNPYSVNISLSDNHIPFDMSILLAGMDYITCLSLHSGDGNIVSKECIEMTAPPVADKKKMVKGNLTAAVVIPLLLIASSIVLGIYCYRRQYQNEPATDDTHSFENMGYGMPEHKAEGHQVETAPGIHIMSQDSVRMSGIPETKTGFDNLGTDAWENRTTLTRRFVVPRFYRSPNGWGGGVPF